MLPDLLDVLCVTHSSGHPLLVALLKLLAGLVISANGYHLQAGRACNIHSAVDRLLAAVPGHTDVLYVALVYRVLPATTASCSKMMLQCTMNASA